MKIAVLGAGSIGCYVAGCLLASDPTLSAANALTLIGRQRLYDDITANGLKVTDWQGREQLTKPEHIAFSIENDSLSHADVILLCVKSQDTEQAASIINQQAKQWWQVHIVTQAIV